MSAATGSDSITLVSIATPEPAWRAAASATILSPRSARAAVRIVSDAPVSPATSTARSTARVAVADPSVPTRIRWYMAPRYPQRAGAPAEAGAPTTAGPLGPPPPAGPASARPNEIGRASGRAIVWQYVYISGADGS